MEEEELISSFDGLMLAVNRENNLSPATSDLLEQFKSKFKTHFGLTAAQKAFDIAEIIEKIYLHLNARHVLNAMGLNHNIKDIILDSPKLRRKLGLSVSDKGTFQTAFEEGVFPGFTVSKNNSEWGFLPPFIPIVSFMEKSYKSLKVGDRCRSMLICQPPVRDFDIRIISNSRHSTYPFIRPYLQIWTRHITVGMVLDHLQRLTNESAKNKREWKNSKKSKGLMIGYGSKGGGIAQ